MWRLQAGPVTPSQEARSLAAPDEGAALNGCDSSDEGQRKCCLDNVSGLSPSVRRRSPGASSKIATVERRKARVPVTRHAGAFKRCPVCSAPTGAPLPHGSEKEKKAPPRRRTLSGADESRLLGCLKIESERAMARVRCDADHFTHQSRNRERGSRIKTHHKHARQVRFSLPDLD